MNPQRQANAPLPVSSPPKYLTPWLQPEFLPTGALTWIILAASQLISLPPGQTAARMLVLYNANLVTSFRVKNLSCFPSVIGEKNLNSLLRHLKGLHNLASCLLSLASPPIFPQFARPDHLWFPQHAPPFRASQPLQVLISALTGLVPTCEHLLFL